MPGELGRVRFALLAQHAIEADGLLSILNAGWTRLDVLEFPAGVALTMVAQAQDVPNHGVIETIVVDPDNEVMATVSTLVENPEIVPRPPLTTIVNVTIPLVLRQPGRYVVRIQGSVEPIEIDFLVASHR